MLDKTLSPRVRGLYLLTAAATLAVGAFIGWAATRVPPVSEAGEFATRFLKGYAAITAGALGYVAVIYFVTFWRGVVTQRVRQRGWAGIGVVYVGLVGWLLAATAQALPEVIRDEVRIFGFVMMLFAAAAWARHRVALAETAVTEKLLEIELRLAEMGEAVARRPVPPA